MKSESKDIKGFVIFGQGRSGSNLLRTLLNSHPKLHCDNELFNINRLNREKPFSKYFIRLFPHVYISSNRRKAKAEVYGFKLFIFHLNTIDKVIQKLHKQGWKIIHIRRKNILKQVFSAAIGQITGRFIRNHKMPVPTGTYNLEVKHIVRGLRRRKSAIKKELAILEKIPHLTVIYEEDLKNKQSWQHTCNRVYDFLGLEPVLVSSRNLVSDPRRDSERIENFDEIMNYLRENGFEEEVEKYFKLL